MKSLNPQDVQNGNPGEGSAGAAHTATPDPTDDSRMAVWEHLDDLRKVLVRSLLMVSVLFCVVYWYNIQFMKFLEQPLLDIMASLPPGSVELVTLGVPDMFTIVFKVCAIGATALSIPFLLYQIWTFIRPALYPQERKYVYPFLIAGTLAFVIGAAFAYYAVIPMGYKFLIEFGRDYSQANTVKPMINLREYVDLTLKMMLAVGLIFETPVLLVILGLFGIVNAKMLAKFRRHAVLLSAVVAAVATPSPDAFTMIIVMIPLYMLYEISIIGVKLTGRKRPSSS